MFTFDPLNERQVANQLGALTKMVVLSVNNQSGANLYAICEAGVEMIFFGKTQQTGTDGNSVNVVKHLDVLQHQRASDSPWRKEKDR